MFHSLQKICSTLAPKLYVIEHCSVGQRKKGKKGGSGSSTTSSSRSDTPTKDTETADKTIADAAKKLKDLSSPGKMIMSYFGSLIFCATVKII